MAAVKKKSTATYAPLVMMGPAGSGKSTIINRMAHIFNNKFIATISYTTR